MRIRLLAVGGRQPRWVREGYEDYARRLPRECRLELIEVPLGKRTRATPPGRAVGEEGARMLARLAPGEQVVALEVTGRSLDTPGLARRLEDWMAAGADLALLVGGPDGLDPRCRERAEFRWSLTPLTLPHGLVRVLVAEQLYRAWSLLSGHPYHRE